MNIAILFGGKSAEHEVSCLSAYSIYQNIDREKFSPILIGVTKKGKFKYYNSDIQHLLDATWENYAESVYVEMIGSEDCPKIYVEDPIKIDCVFPVLHGPFGEDGRIQGILEYADIPYVGCDVISSALCMDKIMAKEIMNLNNIPQTRYLQYVSEEQIDQLSMKLRDFSYPLFIKPANLGSSVGISKVEKFEELERALGIAGHYDRKIIIEEGIDAREIEVGVLQSKNKIIISSPGELIIEDEFYDYDTKYKKDSTQWMIPADLSLEIIDEIKALAKKAFLLLGCKGIARVDFFVEKNTGKIFLNEVNTMPGFTKISMYPKLLDYEGITYTELISKLIDSAMEDYEQKR